MDFTHIINKDLYKKGGENMDLFNILL